MESAPYFKDGEYFEVLFKSAKHSFSPPLMNRRTAEERPNPKELDEGEIEKVHFVLKLEEDDIMICMEKNRDGVTINNIVDYFNHFMRKMYSEKDQESNFHYKSDIIAKDNFIEILRSLNRVSVADVYYDKSILGGQYLNLSDRTVGIRSSVVLSIKPNWGESAKELAIDAFNKFNGATKDGKSKVQKIRIEGKNEFNGDVILDTDFIEKRETVDIEYDGKTGEIVSKDAFRKLLAFLNF